MDNSHLEKMFDLVVHMQENAKEDYKFNEKKGITLNYKQQATVLQKSIQAFMQSVAVMDENKKIIQAFSGSSDLPQLTKDVFNVTQIVPIFDTFWQESFKGIRLKKGQLSWEIADVQAGITFEIIPEGGKVKIYSVSGTKEPVSIEKYGAGIGTTWEMIEGRKLYKFIDLMTQARAALNDLWANIHYGLLANAALSAPITFQGVGTDTILERDIATINKGYETIGSATKAKGYGDTANSKMILYASPNLKARLMQAFRATSADIIRGRRDGVVAASVAGQVIEYAVLPRFTWNSNIPANKAVLILPGNKIQNSMYMQEFSMSDKDIETLSEVKTYWTAFGAIVGDSDQTAELAFV